MKIIEIEWVDSVHSNGWVSGEDAIVAAKELNMSARTIGYMIQEDDTRVTVVQSVGKFQGDGAPTDVDAIMTIPKAAIVKRRYLK